MRLDEQAQASAELAPTDRMASEELAALLEKWFIKHFVKGIKLSQLKGLCISGLYDSFSRCLEQQSEPCVIAVVRKLDPHGTEVLKRTREGLEAHIRDLASGRVEPTAKPKPIRKPKADKGPSGKSAKLGGIYERSRL